MIASVFCSPPAKLGMIVKVNYMCLIVCLLYTSGKLDHWSFSETPAGSGVGSPPSHTQAALINQMCIRDRILISCFHRKNAVWEPYTVCSLQLLLLKWTPGSGRFLQGIRRFPLTAFSVRRLTIFGEIS